MNTSGSSTSLQKRQCALNHANRIRTARSALKRPARTGKILRSVSVSERKTLGSLTERQRLTFAALLGVCEHTRRPVPTP
jgi:hypothetical protein